jgi:antirestriction protein ArdC
MDIYAIVTDKIINLLEQGVVPWRRPWTSAGLPRNLVSEKPYRGINHFLLSASKCVSPFWLTMRQANELGGHVRKGEESTIVAFWKVEDATQSTENLGNEETDGKMRRRFLLRYYRVSTSNNASFRKPYLTSCRRSSRTSTIRSTRPKGSSPQCPTRQTFSTRDRRLSTAA